MMNNFWVGLILGVALYWGWQRLAARKASGQ